MSVEDNNNPIIKYHILNNLLTINFESEEGGDYTPVLAGKSFKEIIGTDQTLSFELVGDKGNTEYLENQYLSLLAKARSSASIEYPFSKRRFRSNILLARHA